jgi:SET domain-containing protein 6
VLFTVPRQLVLSAATAGSEEAQAGNPWESLVLAIFQEKGLGSHSRWAPYLDILPRKFDTLIWWNGAELAELQGSAVKDKIGKESAAQTFKDSVLPMIQGNEAFGLYSIQEESELLLEANIIASAIMAYAFDIEPESQETDDDGYVTDEEEENLPKGMVPFADLLNADADRNNVKCSSCSSSGLPY